MDEYAKFAVFFFENMPEAGYWISMEGRLLNANAAASAMLGYGREELLRLTVLDLDPEYAGEDVQADLDEVKRTGCKTFVRFHTTRDGRKIPVEITSNYVNSGGCEYFCSIVRDISERVRAEKETSFFKALVEYTRDPVYVLDPADGWRMVYANQAACVHYGLEREQLLGMRIPDWDPEFDMGSLDALWEQLKRGKSIRLETVHRRASGELVPVEVTSNYLMHDGKEYSAGYFHDISERKRVEEALRESEERYRGLVELFPDAIYVHTGGKLVFVNPQGARMLGAERPEDLYGREALDFVHPDYRDFVTRRIARAFQEGVPNPPVEQLFLRLDGSVVPVEVSSTAYTYGGQKALQVIARDISERKKVQNELIRAQKLESLGVLAGGIAHDFNNILTGILGNLSVARMRIDSSHPIAGRLERCEKASLQAAELARQLLTFARGGEPVKKLFSVAGLITDVSSFALRGTNVRCGVELAPDLWCLEADEGQISQVLNNLLLNAAQAMPGGGEVSVRAGNALLDGNNAWQLPAGTYVKISVTDQGCGIPAENLPRIFDPYFTTKPQGSGLGLASLYSIVRKHGGAVDIVSAPGEGSCFSVYLPAAAGCRVENDVIAEGELPTGDGRILVMDDEELIRDVAAEILHFLGYQAECCSNGGQAVALYRRALEEGQPFSAAILDLTIPDGMGGREAAARMLEIDPRAVLIVSSGYSNDPVSADFRRYGFSGAIPKPFHVGELAGKLAQLLGARSRAASAGV